MYAMMTYGGIGDIAPFIHILNKEGTWSASRLYRFTHLAINPEIIEYEAGWIPEPLLALYRI
jgi:hypothetical protein